MKQVLSGLLLLVVGCVGAVLLVLGGTDTLVGICVAVAVAGLVLLGHGFLLGTRAQVGDGGRGRDRRAVVALVLAVLVPPLGVLAGAYGPARHRRRAELDTPAIPLGVVLTILYTGLAIAFAAEAPS